MLYFIYFYIVFAFLGAAIGSFLNVVVDRVPQKQSLVFPPSHCPVCGQRLCAWDLFPVASYLILRGRCRYCRAPIPWRILWVELGTAAGFAFLLMRYGLSLELAIACFYWVLFTGFLVIALEQKAISGRIIYPAAAIVLIINIFGHDPGLLNGLIGFGIGLLVMLPLGLGRGRVGWDDVQVAGLAGLALGFPEGLVALVIGVVIAGLVFGLNWLSRAKEKGEAKVKLFAPFIAVAMAIMLFWGQNITGWYLSLF